MRVGATSATQTDQYSLESDEPMRAASVALSGVIELSDWFALQGELGFVRKGTRRGEDFAVRSDYIEMPLLLRFSTPFAYHGARAFLVRGIADAKELRCFGYRTGPDYDVFTSFKIEYDCDDMRDLRTDRSGVLGGGLLLDRGAGQFTIELRRTRGGNVGYACCALHNNVTSVVVGFARSMR